MATNLVFQQAPLLGPTYDLVFGEIGTPADYEVNLVAMLPALVAAIGVGPVYDLDLVATLPALTANFEIDYDSKVDRPLVGETVAPYQDGLAVHEGFYPRHQDGSALHEGFYPRHQDGSAASTEFVERHQDGLIVGIDLRHRHQDGINVGADYSARHQDGEKIRVEARHMHQDGLAAQSMSTARYQDGIWLRNGGDARYQDGLPLRSDYSVLYQIGKALDRYFEGRYQEGIVPPPGTSSGPPIPPGPDPCYIPPLGDQVHLLFAESPAGSDLIFICEQHGPPPPGPGTVVVPIRSVYVVINTTYLRRVAGNVFLPTYSLSLTIDVDSWTWGFNATLPASTLTHLQYDGLPIELEASINGTTYRLLAEDIQRDRQFGNSTIRVSGRGKSALLAAPYSPILTFSNDEERTAQQLMADVLTFNGIPLGWDIDWQIEDWLVPAGVWNKQGTYIDGLTTIAAAAGAYIQPHPTAQELSVMLRYPAYPWDWGSVTADFDLPSAVTTQESIRWLNKPLYNRVYVSGTKDGVLGRVSREGSAGDVLAPMVTDSLITSAIAARQRGGSILANTGQQAMVGLRLPVLPETGIITPGKFVRYDDQGTVRIGIVRSTAVEVGMPDVWQSIQVETHES